jgi:oxaloacetate decarboxylase gamma subunit
MNDEVINLLLESVNLLAVGMAVVFVFLTVLIGVVKLMSALVLKLPEPLKPEVKVRTAPVSQNTDDIPHEVVAAISAAIHQHRQK